MNIYHNINNIQIINNILQETTIKNCNLKNQEHSRNEYVEKGAVDMQTQKARSEIEKLEKKKARDLFAKKAFDNLSKFILTDKRNHTDIFLEQYRTQQEQKEQTLQLKKIRQKQKFQQNVKSQLEEQMIHKYQTLKEKRTEKEKLKSFYEKEVANFMREQELHKKDQAQKKAALREELLRQISVRKQAEKEQIEMSPKEFSINKDLIQKAELYSQSQIWENEL